MSDEAVHPDDQRTVPDPAAPAYESAAVDRARNALRETDEAQTSVPEAVSGAVIGRRYKLLELIGEGGMGVVWMAEQRSPIRRVVAVKLIKAGMDSTAVLARFEAERQALAMMDHPNIARIFDGGTTDRGHPFFVMELVKGLPLTRYCDERKMPLNERLDLFVQVCGAVQHAHQKGIIHRDLKPGNLLVTEHDGKPVPKVIDFGLVKALGGSSVLTDRTLHTSYGAVAGTPQYMAPEQVAINALDVDTRADIYALGVILYELLAGSTPHEARQLHQAAWEEIRRLIREVDPPRPSLRITQSKTIANLAATRHTEPARLCKQIAGDLDWIVMKALEKDRHRRYGTASDLAADLQRHMAGEAVLAAPPTAGYRLRKFTRKHRVALSTAAIVLLVLLAGVLVSTWQAIRASQAETVARRKTADANNQKNEAQREKTEAQRQRLAAVDASAKLKDKAATVQRQLADSYVQNGISAWDKHDPSLAALWFSKALKIDQGDPHRELMDRIRLGDSFRQCAWPSLFQGRFVGTEADDERSKDLQVTKETDGALAVASAYGAKIKVNSTDTRASEVGDVVFISDKQHSQLWNGVSGTPLSPPMQTPYVNFAGSSPDHHFIITITEGSRGWDYGILDARTGDSVALDNTKVFQEIRFSPDHKRIAASNGTQVRVWRLENLKPEGMPIDLAETVEVTELNNNGKLVLTDEGDQWRVWNSDGTSVGPQFTGPYYQNFSLVSPNGKRVLLKRSSTRYSLFDACTGTRLCDPTINSGNSFSFSRDGRSLRSDIDLEWDTRLTTPDSSVLCKALPSAGEFKLSPDGKTLATCEGILRLWNVDTLQPLCPVSAGENTQDVIFAPNTGEIIAFQSDHGRHRLIARNITSGRIVRIGAYVGATRSLNYANPIQAVSSDGNYILVNGWADEPRKPHEVFSTRTLAQVTSIAPVRDARGNSISPASFSVDGHAIIGWAPEGGLAAWNVRTGEIMPDPPHEWRALAVPGVLCPDGKSYLSYDSSASSAGYSDLRIFDLDDGKTLTPPFIGTSRYVDDCYLRLSLGLNGGAVVTQGKDSIRSWDARTAQAITSGLPCDFYVRGACFSRNGTSLLSLSEMAGYSTQILRRWSIAPTKFSAADCELLAEIISGLEIDDLGGVVSAGPNAFGRAFEGLIRLQRESPELFAPVALPPPSDVLPSYRDEVDARFAKAQTPEERQSLAREWAYAGGLEIKSRLYKEAALLEEKSLHLDSSSLAAEDHLAHAYACQGRFSEALAIYQKYAGQTYETVGPWAENGQVGADLSDLAGLWPDGNDDPAFRRILAIYQPPAVSPSTAAMNDAQRLADEAVENFKIGHLAEARELFRKAQRAAKELPNDPNTNAALYAAQSLIDPPSTRPSDDFAGGLGQAAWAVASKPNQPTDLCASALDLARRSVAAEPSARNLSILGAAQFRTGDYEGAIQSLRRSEATDFILQENHVKNLLFTAMAEEKLGRHPEASATLATIAELSRDLEALNDDEIQCFKEAIALIDTEGRPDTRPTTNAAVDGRRNPAATEPSTQPIETVGVLSRRAVYNSKLGRFEEAKQWLRVAIKAGQSTPDDSADGRLLRSARSLIDPASTQPTDPFADGLNTAAWAIVSLPHQPASKYAEALALAQRAVAVHPDSYAINTLGVAQFRATDYQGAIDSFARADGFDFVSPDEHFLNLTYAAMAREKLRHHVLARLLLKRALEISNDPNNALGDDYSDTINEAAALIDPASTQPTTKPADEQPGLRLKAIAQPHPSAANGADTHVTFVNRTGNEVKLFWIDTEGNHKPYGSIGRGERRVQQTFGGHVWLVVGSDDSVLAVFDAGDDPAEAIIDAPGATTRRSTPPTSAPTLK